jgi:Holliday junction DNA helicase RuvA
LYEHLRGILEERTPAHAVVDVGGVGYRVAIPLSTYEKLPPVGKPAQLFVVLVVREDSHRLYGFASRDEREFFLGLQTVSGVGPAVALGIVSSMTWAAFRAAVASGDSARLRAIRGIGKRLSERLVVELKDKLGLAGGASAGAAPGDRASHDAQLALEQLGFAPDAAAAALSELRRLEPSVDDAGELVRRALKRL